MDFERQIKLHPREQPHHVEVFQPQDHPELWALTKGRNGLGELNGVDHEQVLEMFLPAVLRRGMSAEDIESASLHIPRNGRGSFELELIGDEVDLELISFLEPATKTTPPMLSVSDYEATLPTAGGTQAFYRNLGYQLGHMNVPVVYGQKVPWSLGFFIHRVGQVPVALLDDQFKPIQQRIAEKYRKTSADLLSDLSAFSFTLQHHGYTPAELVKPEYRPALAQLQHQFDRMSVDERMQAYPNLVRQAFHLQ